MGICRANGCCRLTYGDKKYCSEHASNALSDMLDDSRQARLRMYRAWDDEDYYRWRVGKPPIGPGWRR
jgi:hypothetical protein